MTKLKPEQAKVLKELKNLIQNKEEEKLFSKDGIIIDG
ncbi:unnamed protein product, partial [marine sediment metagenome]